MDFIISVLLMPFSSLKCFFLQSSCGSSVDVINCCKELKCFTIIGTCNLQQLYIILHMCSDDFMTTISAYGTCIDMDVNLLQVME